MTGYDEELINRIRVFLQDIPAVEEKRMFRKHAFMVDEKLCMGVGIDDVMFRIDPSLYDTLMAEDGTRSFLIKGKIIKSYICVQAGILQSNRELARWVSLSLAYNKEVKPSRKR